MSALSTRAEEYLALRRSLGFTLWAEGRLLRSFAGFGGEEHLATVTTEAALRWATTPGGTSRSWHAQRLGVVRGFARHLRAIDDCCEVPPPELLAFPKGRAQPYLYSQAEIASPGSRSSPAAWARRLHARRPRAAPGRGRTPARGSSGRPNFRQMARPGMSR
jgi:hypothetical protein